MLNAGTRSFQISQFLFSPSRSPTSKLRLPDSNLFSLIGCVRSAAGAVNLFQTAAVVGDADRTLDLDRTERLAH